MDKSKRVIVTGGTGYIGSHTVVELQQKGYEAIIIDNLSNSDISVVDGIEKITGIRPRFENFDLCNRKKLFRLMESMPGTDAIIHFAAYKAVGESVREPLRYYHNNLTTLLNLLEVMEKYNVPSLVFSSSCTVYGQPERLPVTEEDPVQPATSPYGNTKQMGEEIIRDMMYARSGLQAVSLRYFNPIGAHPSGHIGELPAGMPENLVPFITQTAIGIRDQLKVFGVDYNTPDGSCIRDYLHVTDLAKAHIAALERLLDQKNKTNYEVFNLGTGQGVSVLEAIRTFEEATGEKVNYTITGRREGDIEKIWADPSLANKELGWKTEITLAESLRSAWKWENNYRSIKRENGEK
ncbi:MAG: UDP-glucose 4-epimerase GalE [Bacteroidales bacterium]|nr:UDP-glucose 4-epimerase GalE [Bacteroidales bacterium]